MMSGIPRSSRLVLFVCLVSLAVLWSCRLPRLCIFDQCPQCPPNTLSLSMPSISGSSLTPSSHATLPPADGDLSSPDAPFVSWPLARVCAETTSWTPGLVFVCDNNSGGIGNIRNFILTCVRYAIEAGATGIIMPTIQTRSQDKLADLFAGKRLPLSHFFDEVHFRAGLRAACPQMTVYDTLEDVPGLRAAAAAADDERGARAASPEMITPNSFGLRGGCDPRDLDRHADRFGRRLRAWLADKHERLGLPAVGASSPKAVRFSWGVQWTYPVWRDGPELVATLGGLLRLRDDVLQLGAEATAAMRRFAASSGAGAASGPGAGNEPKAEPGFVGMHLRTENDALGGWPDFEQQSQAYLARIAALSSSSLPSSTSLSSGAGTGPGLAFLATGNATEAARFAELALERQQLRVLTKRELLAHDEFGSGELLERLDALSWDQQALVDFAVLLAADYFLGVSPSSFSMTVALKRHLRDEGVYTRPWRVGSEEGDGRSWLVGRYEGYWDDWLFMYESLWP